MIHSGLLVPSEKAIHSMAREIRKWRGVSDPMPNKPPDAVSGAATPAHKCVTCGEPAIGRGKIGGGYVCKNHFDMAMIAGWEPVYLEPAATPEAQIPECVQAPEPYLCEDCEWHGCGGKNGGCGCKCHRPRDMYNRIDHLESQLAALRVERDRAWNEAIEASVKACEAEDYVVEAAEHFGVADCIEAVRRLARPIPAEKPEPK
jgi:hypothetical protein